MVVATWVTSHPAVRIGAVMMAIRTACDCLDRVGCACIHRAANGAERVAVGILADVVLDRFVRALDGFEAVLSGVAHGGWSAPSPCAGWSAADVAGHVIGDLRATEAMACGRDVEHEAGGPGSAVGDDPLASWRAARADLMAALDPGALARLVPGPWGQMPLGEILERSAMEFLVHTWDLAHATRQAAVPDPALVRDVLGPARQFAPLARSSGLVGPEYAVAEDADDLTRLLAILGRRNTGS
jgi:uncharacterized protein (TIGR03086 family)